MTRQELIDYCLTLPLAYEDYPFAESAEDKTWCVMRHGGNKKGFAHIFYRGGLCVNLKCDPLEADFLRQAYEGISLAYHMNKVHWSMVKLDSDVPDEEIRRMIHASYDLIKPKARKRK